MTQACAAQAEGRRAARVCFDTASGERIVASGERIVASGQWSVNPDSASFGEGTLGANQVSRVPKSGCPLPLSAMICGPDGGKTPRKGVEKAVFSGIGYVDDNGATPVSRYS
jgi:hypothetical protein